MSVSSSITLTDVCRWHELGDRPKPRTSVAATLVVVLALHGLAWWLMGAPERTAMVGEALRELPQSQLQPLVVSLVAPSTPRLAAPDPLAHAAAAPNRPPLRPSVAHAPIMRKAPLTASTAAVDASRLPGAPTVADGALIERSAADDGSASRSFHYGSNAQRAVAGAGAANPAAAPPESEFERRTAKAAKTDCRRRHADMGLLAVPMLAYDAMSDSGCRW